jgi:hypothetical protein
MKRFLPSWRVWQIIGFFVILLALMNEPLHSEKLHLQCTGSIYEHKNDVTDDIKKAGGFGFDEDKVIEKSAGIALIYSPWPPWRQKLSSVFGHGHKGHAVLAMNLLGKNFHYRARGWTSLVELEREEFEVVRRDEDGNPVALKPGYRFAGSVDLLRQFATVDLRSYIPDTATFGGVFDGTCKKV